LVAASELALVKFLIAIGCDETERILDKAYTLYVAVMTNFIAPKNGN
jgi:hypothetical protein